MPSVPHARRLKRSGACTAPPASCSSGDGDAKSSEKICTPGRRMRRRSRGAILLAGGPENQVQPIQHLGGCLLLCFADHKAQPITAPPVHTQARSPNTVVLSSMGTESKGSPPIRVRWPSLAATPTHLEVGRRAKVDIERASHRARRHKRRGGAHGQRGRPVGVLASHLAVRR